MEGEQVNSSLYNKRGHSGRRWKAQRKNFILGAKVRGGGDISVKLGRKLRKMEMNHEKLGKRKAPVPGLKTRSSSCGSKDPLCATIMKFGRELEMCAQNEFLGREALANGGKRNRKKKSGEQEAAGAEVKKELGN